MSCDIIGSNWPAITCATQYDLVKNGSPYYAEYLVNKRMADIPYQGEPCYFEARERERGERERQRDREIERKREKSFGVRR